MTVVNVLLLDGVLYGPVHSEAAVLKFEKAIEEIRAEGGIVECGGKVKPTGCC